MTLKADLTRQLRDDEGVKPCVYQDTLGYWTIGVGRLVDGRKKGAGLSPSEIDFLLGNDIDDRIAALTKALPWFTSLNEARQGVLLNMSFQLGVEGLLKFKNTLALVQSGKFMEAASAMKQSLWYRQTPNRAERLAKQMQTGEWVFQ